MPQAACNLTIKVSSAVSRLNIRPRYCFASLNPLTRVHDIASSVILLDAIHMAAASWEEVTVITIQNCFKKAGILMQDDEDEDEDNFDEQATDDDILTMREAWETVAIDGVSLEDYMTADENVVATGVPTEDDIIASVQSTDISPPDLQEEFDYDIDNCGEELIPPATEEAKMAVGTLRAYFSCKENVNTAVCRNLSAIDHTLVYTIANSKTQTRLTDLYQTV